MGQFKWSNPLVGTRRKVSFKKCRGERSSSGEMLMVAPAVEDIDLFPHCGPLHARGAIHQANA